MVVFPACLGPTKIRISGVSRYFFALIVTALITLINTFYRFFCICQENFYPLTRRRRRRSKMKKVINFYFNFILKNMSKEAPSSVVDKLRKVGRVGRELFNIIITGRDLLREAEAAREEAHRNWLRAQGALLFALFEKNMGDPKTVAAIRENIDTLCLNMMSATIGKNGTPEMLESTQTVLYIADGFFKAAKKAYQNPADQETAGSQQP
jgi:hypothetical protein